MFIWFIWNDGSGKTTLAKKITNVKKKSIYIEEFEYFFIWKILKRFFKKSTHSIQNQIKIKQKTIFTKITPYIVFIDLFLEYCFYKIFFSKKIIIRDRTPFDFLMSWKELKVSNKFLDIIYIWLSNKYQNFFIDTDPVVCFERRKLQNWKQKLPNFYEEKYTLYKDNIDYVNYNNICNNWNFDKTIKTITNHINILEKIKKYNTIAISGIDGSGKTTTIQNLSKILKSYNIKHTTIHFYYNYSILKIIKKIKQVFWFYKTKTLEELYSNSIKNEKKSKKNWKNFLWKYFVIFDATLQYFFIKVFSINKLIIFDRFFYDYKISWKFLWISFNEKLFDKLLPSPNIWFLLFAPPDILYDRKPEHTKDFFEECYREYQKVIKQNNLIAIDTSIYDTKWVINFLFSKL